MKSLAFSTIAIWVSAARSTAFVTRKLTESPHDAEGLTLPKTESERQARSRQARASAGGKQIAVMLTPEATAKLAAWVAKGETIAAVVNRLLARSRP